MTTYAFNPDTRTLVATWPSGVGSLAREIGTVNEAGPDLVVDLGTIDPGTMLAEYLTRLSAAAWSTYADATGASDPDEINSPAQLLAAERENFEKALATVRTGSDPRFVPYSPLLHAAQGVGNLLVMLDDETLREAVSGDVSTEFAAVTAADLGDLRGRGQQAITMSRSAASPVQTQAAFDILDADPFESMAMLKTTVDPTSASVAALAWLVAAARAATADGDWVHAVSLADDIEAMPVRTADVVLDMAAATPDDLGGVVTRLVHEAKTFGSGRLLYDPLDPNLLHLIAHSSRWREEGEDSLPACVLDPTRPAPDLLEDLLAGFMGCFLWWRENDENAAEVEDGVEFDEDWEASEEDEAAIEEQHRALFLAEVRSYLAEIDRTLL